MERGLFRWPFRSHRCRRVVSRDGSPGSVGKWRRIHECRGPATYRSIGIPTAWDRLCLARGLLLVFISTIVHGLSTLVISISNYVKRDKHECAPVINDYTEGLNDMVHDEDEDEEEEAEEEEHEKKKKALKGDARAWSIDEEWGNPAYAAMLH